MKQATDTDSTHYSQCSACGQVSEHGANGVNLVRHAPLCLQVQSLEGRLQMLEDALVRAGLIEEFRP